MKPRDQNGVVDSCLNVYGVQHLKVADMSICPSNVATVRSRVVRIHCQDSMRPPCPPEHLLHGGDDRRKDRCNHCRRPWSCGALTVFAVFFVGSAYCRPRMKVENVFCCPLRDVNVTEYPASLTT